MREDWVEVKLGELCKFSQGVQVPKGKQYTEDNKNRVRFLRIIDFTQGKDESRYIDKPNDINIVAKDDISMVRYGTVGFVCTGIEGAIANNLFRIIPNIDINKKFLINFLNSVTFKSQINAKGATMQALSFGLIKPIKVTLPPFVEQKAIVKKIEELFSSLDSGIADLKKAQDQLVIYRQAVLKKAFEGELTKEWRERQINLPSADELLEQIKEERQKHYEQQLTDWKEAVKLWEEQSKYGKKPIKPRFLPDLPDLTESEVDLLAKLPTQWKWERANNVMKLITNGSTPKGNKVSTEKNEIPFLKIHNLALNGDFLLDNKLHYISKDTSSNYLYRSIIYPNDILINTVGPPLGKAAVVDSTFPEYNANQNVTIYRTFSSLNPKYIKYFMICSNAITWIKEIATATSGQSYFNLGNCRSIPIPINSIEEQHQIVQEIESRLSVCDKVEKDITDSLEKAQALRQSILKKAFEGKLLSEEEIAACKAHPEYEPASVLLGRIKEEKATNPKKKK